MLNTKLKTAAKDEFEKKLVASQDKYATYVMNSKFKDWHPFSKELFDLGKKQDQDKQASAPLDGCIGLDQDVNLGVLL